MSESLRGCAPPEVAAAAAAAAFDELAATAAATEALFVITWLVVLDVDEATPPATPDVPTAGALDDETPTTRPLFVGDDDDDELVVVALDWSLVKGFQFINVY